MEEAMTKGRKVKARRLLCYYGDDFTGSTDVLEALFRAGLRTVLFLEPPSEEMLGGRFEAADCFGVAGIGRSLPPEAMERELRPLFEMLQRAGAAVFHYKVCSTFDSSPDTGSIGKAAEIGREVFMKKKGGYIPLLVGVPYLKRYTLFGHHFAGAGGHVYRLDRHPTMSLHPVTPMRESDLREHLKQQTKLLTSLLDIVALDGLYPDVRGRLEAIVQNEQPDLVLFDVLDERRLATAGRLIWEQADQGEGIFVIGSSGVEYALTSAWREAGLIPAEERLAPTAQSVDRLLVVSGSCSPITERQLKRAFEAGYAGIRVPVTELMKPEKTPVVMEKLRQETLQILKEQRSVILYSAAGPADASIGELRDLLTSRGLRPEDSSAMLGALLGALARELVMEAGLTRIVIAGGDTSGYVTRELGIFALECKATLEPGGPLCRAYSHHAAIDGLEMVLKGGQVGSDGFFEHVRLGGKPVNASEV
ncbi:four-carbon acid sugar kinase family protein [Paenibacillus sp. GD4]|uniref:four-carbon acid sugar kinase family protein n=1 Tax=Paenibacillus sp. GD4 TaxID=3068890 RepID=UPI002796E137|nr:four-carbon acid sugar kinase family protein [Paenibacillus sp. GD4]MDQ1913649.1 four-carbon acid sugar kinase family protein [Paenibacillus sp. GD4]